MQNCLNRPIDQKTEFIFLETVKFRSFKKNVDFAALETVHFDLIQAKQGHFTGLVEKDQFGPKLIEKVHFAKLLKRVNFDPILAKVTFHNFFNSRFWSL